MYDSTQIIHYVIILYYNASLPQVRKVLSVTCKREPFLAQVSGTYSFERKVEKPGSSFWRSRLAGKTYSHVRIFNSNVFSMEERWALYEWRLECPNVLSSLTRTPRIMWKYSNGSVLLCPPGHTLWTIPLGQLVCTHSRGDPQ